MLDKKQKNKFIREKILKTENEILITNLLIGFYELLDAKEEKTDAVKKGGYQMKIDQLKQSNEFNTGFLDFMESELKA